jgi:polyphenol oxidase
MNWALPMMKFQNRNILVFFGGVEQNLSSLQGEFPHLNFKKIKQTHSDIVVEAGNEIVEADAQYTEQKNQALVIATADCLPVMIYCKQTQRVAAVHAGWKGVENKITEKTLHQMIKTGSSEKDFQIFIGPHILQNSFEVSEDVYALLSKAHYGLKAENYSQKSGDKYSIDLNKIVQSQIENALNKTADLLFVSIDTKTDTHYHSYRRDQKTKERNLSFIAKV